MQSHFSSPKQMFISFWQSRGLIYSLTKRDVVGRYRGSILGVLWALLNPIFMLTVYTFVFSVVFKARWNGGGGSKIEFALLLFAGLIMFNLFVECINRAPVLILSNANYVKKVVFPLEVLPWVSLGVALFHTLISLGVWLLAYVVFFGFPHITFLLIPFVMMPLLIVLMGISWALASLGVYLRDLSQMVGMLTTVIMFLSPIFYPITAIPESYQWLLMLNPLATIIEQAREVLYWGSVPDIGLWFISLGGSSLIALIGFAWFQKTRKGFADVL